MYNALSSDGKQGDLCPLGARRDRIVLLHIQDTAPVVEIRPLAAY
jgi:hypothetical protein